MIHLSSDNTSLILSSSHLFTGKGRRKFELDDLRESGGSKHSRPIVARVWDRILTHFGIIEFVGGSYHHPVGYHLTKYEFGGLPQHCASVYSFCILRHLPI